MNQRQIKQIGRTGYVNKNGRRVYGSAAVLHFLYLPTDRNENRTIRRKKKFIETN